MQKLSLKNQQIMILALCFLFLSMSNQSIFAFPTVYPTGTTIYNPNKTFEGYTIYTDLRQLNHRILLIDMQGNILHYWKNRKFQFVYAEPILNGNLLILASKRRQNLPDGLVELDWNGNAVWEYFSDAEVHHDSERLESGNTLILCSKLRDVPEISPKPIKE